MGDPLFDHGLNLAVWLILIVKSVAVFAIVLVLAGGALGALLRDKSGTP